MNRGDLRTDIRALLAWDIGQDAGTEQTRLNEAIRHGLDLLYTEAPEALYPQTPREVVPGTLSSGAYGGTTLSTTSDPWVLQFVGGTFAPVTDRTWDGMYHLEVTAKGQTYRFWCREFWLALTGEKYVSLDRPWTSGTATGLSWTLVAQYLWCPSEWSRIHTVVRWGSTGGPMRLTTATQAANQWQTRNQVSIVSGYPTELRREHSYQQRAPTRAPAVALVEGTWAGEPTGQFEYCFTYCWGYRDLYNKSPSGTPIPLFESAPSPISGPITSTAPQIVRVTVPEVDWMVNFNVAGALRAGHSGLYKRIYRRRKSITGGTHQTIEYPDVFQALADVDGPVTTYDDDGAAIPDYTLRLPEQGVYYAWSMWPTPDARTEMDIRVTCRPPLLLNDNDSPAVVPEYRSALALFCAHWYARRDQDEQLAQVFAKQARDQIGSLRAQTSNPTGKISRDGFGGRLPTEGPLRYRGS